LAAAPCNLTITFFQLLVNVFYKQFNSDQHTHFKNFYIIVPALTINFVEYLVSNLT
jgi:WASH complex subunit 7